MTEHDPETGPQDQTVAVTRVFDAPRELVFKAWTDPEHITAWWGPEGFHSPVDTITVELHAGGRYHLDMVQEDGTRFPLHFEIVEVVAPELLVLKCPPMPELGMPEPTVTRIELREDGAKTHLTLTDGPYTAIGRDHAEAGWLASFDKLDAMLGQ